MKIALKLRISSCVGGFTNGLPVHVAQRPKHMYLKYSINVTFRFSQCDKPL